MRQMLCQWGYDRAQVAALGATCHVAVTRRYPLAVSTWSQFESLAPSPSWLPMGGLDPKVCPPGVRPPGPGGNGPGEASATGPWETLQGLGCTCVPLAPEPVPGAYQGERGRAARGIRATSWRRRRGRRAQPASEPGLQAWDGAQAHSSPHARFPLSWHLRGGVDLGPRAPFTRQASRAGTGPAIPRPT